MGFFYLKHKDIELANKSFLRAQTIEPELSEAWLGQAILALEHNDFSAAKSLINHTVSISNGRLVRGLILEEYIFKESSLS